MYALVIDTCGTSGIRDLILDNICNEQNRERKEEGQHLTIIICVRIISDTEVILTDYIIFLDAKSAL